MALTDIETGLSSQPVNQKLEKTNILKIDIDDIHPNELNIMSTEDIDELAESIKKDGLINPLKVCLLYTSPSPRDGLLSRMPSSA